MQVTMVRVYFTEGEKRLQLIMRYLHDEKAVAGITVFRGITGFGKSGSLHSSSLLDLSLDLPLVVEFFDNPEKVKAIINDLKKEVKPGHIIWWPATIEE